MGARPTPNPPRLRRILSTATGIRTRVSAVRGRSTVRRHPAMSCICTGNSLGRQSTLPSNAPLMWAVSGAEQRRSGRRVSAGDHNPGMKSWWAASRLPRGDCVNPTTPCGSHGIVYERRADFGNARSAAALVSFRQAGTGDDVMADSSTKGVRASQAAPRLLGSSATRSSSSSRVPVSRSRSAGGRLGRASAARSPWWMSASTAKNRWSRPA